MSDEHPQGSGQHDSTGWIILGALLIVVGVFLGARNLGIVPWPFDEVWNAVVKARFGIGVLVLGILLIIWAQSDRRVALARKGVRLYRSREDKWFAGVLGGLASYFGLDPTILRLAFIALLILGVDGLIIVYIVMAIVVPYEPKGGQPAAQAAPEWPQQTAATPPAAPEQPASPAAPSDDVPPPAPPL